MMIMAVLMLRLARCQANDDMKSGWRGGVKVGVLGERLCVCVCVCVFMYFCVLVCYCMCVCVGRLKRLNPSLATVTREKTPLRSALTAGRLLHWRPICAAPCPARGISLFFYHSSPTPPHPPRLLFAP